MNVRIVCDGAFNDPCSCNVASPSERLYVWRFGGRRKLWQCLLCSGRNILTTDMVAEEGGMGEERRVN